MKPRLLVGIMILAACGPAPERGQPEPPEAGVRPTDMEIARATRTFGELRDGFLPWYYRARPVRASAAGVRLHDDRWPGMGRAAIQVRIDSLLHWLGELERIPFAHLEGDDRFDYGTLEYVLRGELLDLEEVRSWVRDPRLYTATIATGIASLAERSQLPVAERVPALRSRLRSAPEVLAAARENLSRPPELWTRLGIEHAEGLIEFLESDLPPLLAGQPGRAGASLPEELREDRDRLVAALQEHRAWLESDLLDRSTGDVSLGRYLFERKLLYEEHIALEVPQLDRLNRGMIAEYQDALVRVAGEIDPDRGPRQVLDSLADEHPAPDELLDTARALMVSLRDWVAESDVVTLPDPELPVVRPMPPYQDDVASLDGPGAFETGPTYFSLATPRPDWAEARQREHMARFGAADLVGMTARNTFPGRYVQLSHERESDRDVRRLFTARSFAEGWAHYAEGMAVDEGYGGGDPGIRLAQLQRALQQHARWDAALHIHGLGTPLEEVVSQFMDIAYMGEAVARREVVRATYDPLYLAAALGRLQIIELREDYRAWLEERDETFVLQEFHDRLLDLALPLPLTREVMIPLPEPEARPRTRRRR